MGHLERLLGHLGNVLEGIFGHPWRSRRPWRETLEILDISGGIRGGSWASKREKSDWSGRRMQGRRQRPEGSRTLSMEVHGIIGRFVRSRRRGRRIEDASGESPPPPALLERPLWLILETREAKIVEKTMVCACFFVPAVGGEALRQNLTKVLDRVFPQLARKQLGEHWEQFSVVWGP